MLAKNSPDPGLPTATPTESYWQTPRHALASHQSPRLPSEASVVVIGSGITGTSIVHHMLHARPDMDIVMLEARTLSSGATGRNGGHCKDVPFKTYKKWKTDLGREAAKRLGGFRQSHIEATRHIAEALRKEEIADAQFRDVESVTAVYDPEIFQELKGNMEAWLEDFPEEQARYSSISGAEAEQKYGVLGAVGVLVTPAAALWPYRLTTGVIDRLLRKHKNFVLETLTPVLSIAPSHHETKPYAVNTPRGQIRARHIIHCTNGYASHLLPALRDTIVPVRGQMTALEPSESFPRFGHKRSWSMYWPNGGFDYMTQAKDKQGHIFLGGGVEQGATAGVIDFEQTDDAEINKPALEHLCSVLPDYFERGAKTKLRQAWTGIMGFTGDGFPIVGKIPRNLSPTKLPSGTLGSEYIAAGFNGYGMVHCWQSGKAIVDMILERPQHEIDEYFPRQQFELSPARLQNLDYADLRSSFYKNAPKSRL